MRGQTRGSPVLVQRAVSEDPRWTRAVGAPLAHLSGETVEEWVSFDARAEVRSEGRLAILYEHERQGLAMPLTLLLETVLFSTLN